MLAAKKPRGRAAANRVTKPAQTSSTRRASGRVAALVEREVLGETSENQPPKSTRSRKAAAKKSASAEDEEEEDVLATPPHSDEPKKTKGRGRPKAASKATAKEVPDSVQRNATATTTKRAGRKPLRIVEDPTEERSEIPETQQYAPMDIDDDEHQDQVEDLPNYTRTGPASAQRMPSYQAPFSATKRPTSSSDHESDPSVRRRLGEMTKKCENLELKYRDLREIAVKEAERNFDKLQKQGEERTQAANELIASLKKELAAQKELAKVGQRLQKQLEESEAEVNKLQAQVMDSTSSLSEAKSEIKALTTKLSAARAGEAQATANAARVPGSAMKKSSVMASRKDEIQATQTAKMKEDLYSDLTGLIVAGIKRDGPEDVYDCIQTGRNGTLHFKLSIANENSAENYEEAQFMYMPQLDDNRDNKLIELLPDYLVEEITFPRPHAAKFYARVQKSLTERLE